MFGIGKRKKTAQVKAPDSTGVFQEKQGLFKRLKQGLSRTRHNLTDGLADLMLGHKSIDDDLLEELETLLLTADVGVEATSRIIDDLTNRVRRKELADPETLSRVLKEHLLEILLASDRPAPARPPPSANWRASCSRMGRA
jgi:fused signal recognition particle receptor